MTNFKKILLFCSLMTFTTSAFSLGSVFSDSYIQTNQQQKEEEELSTITITINSTSIFKLKGVPKIGHLEIMSILGKRVTIKKLKDCVDGVYIDLPNGLYVIKAGKVSQKIVIRN